MDAEKKLAAGVALVLKHFPDFTEGTVEQALRVCQKSDGLIVYPMPEPVFMIAYFHYWPKLAQAVADQDFDVLEEFDLGSGPLLHIAAFVTPKRGYYLVRNFIRSQNPWGVTAHHYDPETQEWTFVARKNHYYRPLKEVRAHG